MIAIRLAAEADAPVLARIAVAAYQHYVPRIGRPPAPMTADYPAAVRRGQAWVAAVDGEVAGFIILIPQPGYLLLENVAVLPAAQGRGIGARLRSSTLCCLPRTRRLSELASPDVASSSRGANDAGHAFAASLTAKIGDRRRRLTAIEVQGLLGA